MDCRTQLAELASDELDKGDFLMATKILTTGIKLDPDNHELYYERSICYHKLGDFQASLNDASEAIRINSEDYLLHYQKGLALLGLSLFEEAKSAFKKAIELRAKQEDSRLYDIFELLKNAIYEWNARRRPGRDPQPCGETLPINGPQTAGTSKSASNREVVSSNVNNCPKVGTGSPSCPNQSAATTTTNTIINTTGNNSLVSVNRNIINSSTSQYVPTNGVQSTASHLTDNRVTSTNGTPVIRQSVRASTNSPTSFLESSSNHDQNLQLNDDDSKSNQFDWSIRRSERIFLHGSNGQLTPNSQQFGPSAKSEDQSMLTSSQIQKTDSIQSSSSSARGNKKRIHDIVNSLTMHQPSKRSKSKDNTSLNSESDIDVDDSFVPPNRCVASPNVNESLTGNKRVLVAPSSSMPATSNAPSTSTAVKDGSYSTKYKRLRRDRERARRGTSKLCTIKQTDLNEMRSDPSKRTMRVIAPIDGWLYSGILTLDDGENSATSPQYVVKLDGDPSGSSYLFKQDTVLSDVIKEVRVNSVSELRKGARICCYWSRQYKCLSTGVVTSRTFEVTKSLVSVKYDNGDLSALPLEDLRLLPPDYPKYMSNCDPLLLARSSDPTNGFDIVSGPILRHNETNRVIVEATPNTQVDVHKQNSDMFTSASVEKHDVAQSSTLLTDDKFDVSTDSTQTITQETDYAQSVESRTENRVQETRDTEADSSKDDVDDEDEEEDDNYDDDANEDEDASIPPTAETIEFITSESTLKEQSENLQRIALTENASLPKESRSNASRASSEENNFSFEYWPWMFDGPSKKIKRHGRPYRELYPSIRRGSEVIKVGDSAELMPRDKKTLPFIAKIDALWANSKGEMKVRVRWYYRLSETRGKPKELEDGENALFETDHFDENDVQSIHRTAKILSWTEYSRNFLGHINKSNTTAPSVFYIAGYYNPVRQVKNLRSDVKESQST